MLITLQAEANDMPTTGGQSITLERILTGSQVDLGMATGRVKHPSSRAGDGGMLVDQAGTIRSSSSIDSSPPRPLPSRIPLLPTRVVPAHLLAAFTSAFRPIASSLDPATSQSSDSNPTFVLRSILASLERFELSSAPISGERESWLRAIGAVRTILSFVFDDKKTRRSRTGEVADSLELLADGMSDLEILDCMADLLRLAQLVRQLP